MYKAFLRAIIIFIPIVIAQLTIIPLISFNNIGPDLVLILVVFYALRYGQLFGTVLGFILGFIFDLFSGGMLGAAMFSKTLSGFIAGYFYKDNKSETYSSSSRFVFIFIVFLCSTIDSFFYSLLASSEIIMTFAFLFFEQGLFPGFYTAVLSLSVIIFKPRNLIK